MEFEDGRRSGGVRLIPRHVSVAATASRFADIHDR